MQSEADIKKALDAAYAADPQFRDERMELTRDVLRWVLGGDYDSSTVDEFIEMHIGEAGEED